MITNPEFSSGKARFFQGIITQRSAPSAFCFIMISSIRQSKTSAEARRAPSVTEAATSLRKWSREQLTFQSRPPAGRHLKISRIRDCAGLHRPADFILICFNRANSFASYDACKRCGVVQRIDFYVAGNIRRCRQLWVLANRSIWRKIGIDRAIALRVISISLAHTLPSFYFVCKACRLETTNFK